MDLKLRVLRVFLLVAGTICVASLLATQSSASTTGNHVRMSATWSGRTLSVEAQADPGIVIYELKAHLCAPGRRITTSYDFGFEGRRCPSISVGGGTVERVAAFGTGVTHAQLTGFRAGIGSVHWVNELGFDQRLTCGPSAPCAVVVRAQITNGTAFFTFPVCYAARCNAPATATTIPGAASNAPRPVGTAAGSPLAPVGARSLSSQQRPASAVVSARARSAVRQRARAVSAPDRRVQLSGALTTRAMRSGWRVLLAALAGALAAAWLATIFTRRRSLVASLIPRRP